MNSIARRSFSSSTRRMVPLLLTPEAYKKLPKSSTIPLDVSWHMPNSPRSAAAEYLSGPRIPRARRWDLDEVAELEGEKNLLNLTHMLPSKKRFVEECRKLGIKDDTHVVLYDTIGVFSAPRGAFTFLAFGHKKVSVLDGGLPRWIDDGGDVEMGETKDSEGVERTDYQGGEDKSAEYIRSYEQIVENSEKTPESAEAEIVLDHRPLARYTAEAPEPRPSLSSGHIPNSLPLPFSTYLEPSSTSKPYTSLKTPSELRDILTKSVGGSEAWSAVEKGEKGLVFTCGSGMTAAVGWLANEILKENGGGAAKAAIYDESWTGYASRSESKIVKGKNPA